MCSVIGQIRHTQKDGNPYKTLEVIDGCCQLERLRDMSPGRLRR